MSLFTNLTILFHSMSLGQTLGQHSALDRIGTADANADALVKNVALTWCGPGRGQQTARHNEAKPQQAGQEMDMQVARPAGPGVGSRKYDILSALMVFALGSGCLASFGMGTSASMTIGMEVT